MSTDSIVIMQLFSKEKKEPAYVEDNLDQVVTTAEGDVVENADDLHRRLGNRQIQLIAIGGSIGTAIFVSVGMSTSCSMFTVDFY